MIKQLLWKKKKLSYGVLNTYILNKGQKYNDTEWWDSSFYTGGISDRQTISQNKSLMTARYHYASMQLLILRHLRNKGTFVGEPEILDVGSGSGQWIDFYDSLDAGSITGMDVSLSSFNYLKNKYSGDHNIKIYHGKALEAINKLTNTYHIVNAIGVMFHIVDDTEWKDTISAIGNILKEGGLFIVGGHFGFLDGLNVQIDKNGNINKRLRSKRRWIHTLRKSGFTKIEIYRNNAYLWINDTLPENNVLIATK